MLHPEIVKAVLDTTNFVGDLVRSYEDYPHESRGLLSEWIEFLEAQPLDAVLVSLGTFLRLIKAVTKG